jgi:hypothetical protein
MKVLQAAGAICLICSPVFGQATVAPNGVSPDDLSAAAATNLTLMQGQIQAATTNTLSDGTFSGTWAIPFSAPPTGYLADIPSSGNTPYKCTVSAVTATTFSGKCWQLVATTLPTVATALLGLTVSPISNATSGLPVRVVGRQ